MTFALVVAAFALSDLPAQRPIDACAQLAPGSLQSTITRAHPGSRLVRESDYAAHDIASELQYRAGNRCLGAASGDVNDDGRNDFVFLIATKNEHALLIAALSMPDGHWKLSTLETFNSPPRAYFVNTLPPDKYTDLFASDNAPDEWRPEPGRVRRYTSRRPGFIAGALGSTAVAYFYTGTRWVHLWLSD